MLWNNPPLVIYHATKKSNAKRILDEGIKLDFASPRSDFGYGFYTTTSYDQAVMFGRKYRNDSAILKYTVARNRLSDMSVLFFTRPDDECNYWDFIRHCRTNSYARHFSNDDRRYDIVIGPVARVWDQKPFEAYVGYDQISFHTEQSVLALNSCVSTVNDLL